MAPVLLLILFLSIFIILALVHRYLQKNNRNSYSGIYYKESFTENLTPNQIEEKFRENESIIYDIINGYIDNSS